MADVGWLWLAAVAALFLMVGVSVWRDRIGVRVVVWLKWQIVKTLDKVCVLTGHRYCHVFPVFAIKLIDKWGLEEVDDDE